MRSAEESGFGTRLACSLAGITYRQADYWDRTGLVSPSLQEARGSGSGRSYSFRDVVELRVVAQLLAAGVSLGKIRAAIGELRRRGEDLAGVTLLSDGATIYACESPEEVVDVVRQGQAVFGLALGPVLERMRGSVLEVGGAGSVRELPHEGHGRALMPGAIAN